VGVIDTANHQLALFVDPTASSFYKPTAVNNADAVAAWTPGGATSIGAYSLLVSGGDNALFGNVPTATMLTLSPNPAGFGQSISLTATVLPAGAPGSITFLDGSTTLGSSTLANGRADILVPAGQAGLHSLTAAYSGDAINAPSSSAALMQTVNQP